MPIQIYQENCMFSFKIHKIKHYDSEIVFCNSFNIFVSIKNFHNFFINKIIQYFCMQHFLWPRVTFIESSFFAFLIFHIYKKDCAPFLFFWWLSISENFFASYIPFQFFYSSLKFSKKGEIWSILTTFQN